MTTLYLGKQLTCLEDEIHFLRQDAGEAVAGLWVNDRLRL